MPRAAVLGACWRSIGVDKRRRRLWVFAARFAGRVGLAVAAGAIFGQASGASSRIVLAWVPVGVGLFLLGLVVDHRAETRASGPADP